MGFEYSVRVPCRFDVASGPNWCYFVRALLFPSRRRRDSGPWAWPHSDATLRAGCDVFARRANDPLIAGREVPSWQHPRSFGRLNLLLVGDPSSGLLGSGDGSVIDLSL